MALLTAVFHGHHQKSLAQATDDGVAGSLGDAGHDVG